MAKIQPSSDLSLRRKEQVFAEGYQIQVATELTPGVASNDLVDHVFGDTNPLLETVVDNGTLTMTVLEKKSNNSLLEVLTGQDPDASATAIKKFASDDSEAITVFVNKKNKAEDGYERSFFFEDWSPAAALSAGAPNERSARSITGNSKKPIEFENAAIMQEKITLTSGGSGYTGTLNNTAPGQVPGFTARYAIRVVAIEGGGSATLKDSLTVTDAMVTSAGAVTIVQSDLTFLNVDDPDRCVINYLQQVTTGGIFPDNSAVIISGLYSA